ncbi:hypothetical protein K435DRAFT_390473 [Dendrothele bispora CBS 962.96]|uniref:Uncharacterized protein n=1 Tax=Dendrothele bispora (strain CBS 962.96) TaxID=1314807 RepID=A0A4S8KVQ3_DENBC|nr:hypothetical protein K435DRAFT_513129 [Dendrothele bispora CBS 962.96]THU85354.1 hypothetical protein K435DRAFT_390473 [Dendrothele bispora CBS 962.96]
MEQPKQVIKQLKLQKNTTSSLREIALIKSFALTLACQTCFHSFPSYEAGVYGGLIFT